MKLCVRGCHNLQVIPNLSQLIHLEEVEINGSALKSLPNGFGTRLTSLLCFSIVECPALRKNPLRKNPDSLGDCFSLMKLCIRDCHNLEVIPDLSQLIHLEEVKINGTALKSLPSGLEPSSLHYFASPFLEVMPDLSQLIHLEEAEINGCKKLTHLPKGLQILPLLNSLSIGGLESLDIASSSSMTSQLHFPALKLLRVIDNDCAEQVPDWVGNLSSLQKLELEGCKNLMHLPSRDVILKMTRLTALTIRSCPLLQEKCAKDGAEWDKISHIHLIRVDTKTIQERSS
ncbi:Protein SUPPRESSOR OF npr1-1 CONSTITUTIVE 1 [Bienertia sinuspersici]